MSGAAIVRTIVGPFRSIVVTMTFMAIMQCTFDMMMACVVSLQLKQVLSIFCPIVMNEIKEELLVTVHRLFVTFLGLSAAFTKCFLRDGMCRPTPFYYFLLNDDNEFFPSYTRPIFQALVKFDLNICGLFVTFNCQ